MAKPTKPKKESPNKKTKSEKKADKTGNLFLEHLEQKNEIPLEITNNENTVINYKDNMDTIEESPNMVQEPKVAIKNSSSEKTVLKEISNIPYDIFTLDKPTYIEIHKANLLQYISSGIIFPSKYSSQKAFSDPQSFEPSTILLSNGQISKNESEILLIEIASNAIDNALLVKTTNYALYSGVIPISRIIKIFVATTEIKKKIIDDSLLRDGGLLPENLLSVGLPNNLSKVEYEDDNNKSNIDFTDKLEQYDKILGLIAGSRNFSLLSFNQTHSFKSISDHSFYSIQALDNDFAKDIVVSGKASDYYKWLFLKSCPDDRVLLKWIFNRVYHNNNFTDSDTMEFEHLCYKSNAFYGEEKQVELIFGSLKKSLDRKKVFPEILKLQSKNGLALYVFSFLRNYGTKQSPELPRIDISHSAPSKYSEYAFATLNFFFGYKQLRNSEDRINIADKKLSEALKTYSKAIIKFEMNSLFDYKVIDSVFNQVFHSEIKIKENDYAHYKTITDKNNAQKINIDGYNYFSVLLYGKLFEHLIKINPIDELLPLLNKLPNDISLFSEFGLCCYRIGLKMNSFSFSELFINPAGLKKMFSYSRNALIDALKDNKMDIDEIKQRIILSQKHKEL